jgi:hypothetical protein
MHAELDADAVAAGTSASASSRIGQLLFEHEYNFADGLGGGDAASAPAGPFRRVHGALRRSGDHLVSLVPLGRRPNGAGAETDIAFLAGDGERPRAATAERAGAGRARRRPGARRAR